MKLSGYYNGFQRTDERNMLDFLDGISNLDPTEREGIIFNTEAPTIGLTNLLPPDLSMIETHKKMLKDSTYMCFLRILVDFLAWRSIDGKEQSKIVGRDKITGCPLDSQSPDKPVTGCPISGSNSILDRGNSQFRDYNKFLEKSHINRVRKFDNNRIRIFRQGYNFFDSTDDYPYIKVGLNFVSFQNDLSRLHTILTNDQWMGGATFGGIGNELANMFKIESAGMFFVPPMNDKFPGSEIFEPDNRQ